MRSGRIYSEDDPIFDVIEALSAVTVDIKAVNDKLAITAVTADKLGKNLDDKKLSNSVKQLESFVDFVKNFNTKLSVMSFVGGLLCAGLPTYLLYMKSVTVLEEENARKIDQELSDVMGRADELHSIGVEAAKDGIHLEYQRAEHNGEPYGVLMFKKQVYLSKDNTAVWVPIAEKD